MRRRLRCFGRRLGLDLEGCVSLVVGIIARKLSAGETAGEIEDKTELTWEHRVCGIPNQDEPVPIPRRDRGAIEQFPELDVLCFANQERDSGQFLSLAFLRNVLSVWLT